MIKVWRLRLCSCCFYFRVYEVGIRLHSATLSIVLRACVDRRVLGVS